MVVVVDNNKHRGPLWGLDMEVVVAVDNNKHRGPFGGLAMEVVVVDNNQRGPLAVVAAVAMVLVLVGTNVRGRGVAWARGPT